MPCGSLEDQENISADECLSILWQGLCALTYLHSHEPPIVHRDIKPGNILVQHRFPGDDIFVKFGDFGLSRDSCDLSTVCGSQHYLAPEIYCRWQYINSGGKERTSYTPAVDVWSLGVVAYELLCDLPPYQERYTDAGTTWCKKVVKRFKEDCKQRPDKLRRFLLDAMVVISSDLRCSAQVCSDQVALLTSAAEDGCQTPTPASYAYGEEQTSRYNPEDRVAENQETVLWQQASPSVDNHSTTSTDTSRHIRSDAPPPKSRPSASKATRKRAAAIKTSSSSSSSSSARRQTKRRESRSGLSGSIPRQKPELACFLENYSADPLNSLYVGSSLVSWGGEEEPDSWANQSSDAVQNQPEDPDVQTDRGSRLASPRDRSSLPRSHGDGWRFANGDPIAGGGDSDPLLDLYADEEMTRAAIMLQAIGQDLGQYRHDAPGRGDLI